MLYEMRTAARCEPQPVDPDAAPPGRGYEVAFHRALNESRHDNFAYIAEDLLVQLVLRQLPRLADESERREVTGTESAVTRIRSAPSARRLSTVSGATIRGGAAHLTKDARREHSAVGGGCLRFVT
jgi:hypothetical protein